MVLCWADEKKNRGVGFGEATAMLLNTKTEVANAGDLPNCRIMRAALQLPVHEHDACIWEGRNTDAALTTGSTVDLGVGNNKSQNCRAK